MQLKCSCLFIAGTSLCKDMQSTHVPYRDGSQEIIATAVSEPEANKQRQLSNRIRLHYRGMKTFLRNARNCGSGKIKGGRNFGHAQMEKLACVAFRVFSHIEGCSKMRCSQLCKLLFLRLLLLVFFLHFCHPLLLGYEWAWTTKTSVLHK